MALEDIIKTILKEAEEKAQEILSESQKKVKEIKEEYKKKASEVKERIFTLAKDEERQILSQAKIKTQLFFKNRLLAKKQELINKVFEQSLDKLTKLPKNREVEFLVSLLNQTPRLEGKVEIRPAKGKEKIIEEAIRKAKKDFILSKGIEAKGGFVLVSKDLEIDNTFEAILKQKREILEAKIAQILFK